MKILAIRGKNLASLAGEFAIALEEGPLAAAGLFAITGPTGAGKSTLLDALCLALYDAVPRLVDGSGAAVGRAGESEELRLRGNDVRGLLRRGTADGFAETDFLGGDGKRYRARWEVRRARNRPGGRLQAQSLSLCDLESGQFLGRTKTEVLEAIEERLGLSFEQFRRSSLLAQGDFAAFLKERPAERSELLERITGTEIYGLLSSAAHARASEERANLRTMEERLGDLRPLDAEARSELEGRCEQTAAALRIAEEEKGRLQSRLDAHRRLKDLRRGEACAEEVLLKAEGAREGAAPRREALKKTERAQPLRVLVQQYDGAESDLAMALAALREARQAHRLLEESVLQEEASLVEAGRLRQRAEGELARFAPLIRQARDLDIRIGEAKRSLETACVENASLVERAGEEKEALQILLASRSEAQKVFALAVKWLEEHDDDAVLARRWELWDGEFRRYARAMNELREAEEDLKRLRGEEARLEEEMRGIALSIERTDSALRELEETRKTLEGAAASFSPGDLTREREELERRRERLRALIETASEGERLREERSGLAASMEGDRYSAEAAAQEAQELREGLTGMRAVLQEARRSLESARTARKEEVESLRARLREGEACPVCGALDHPWAEEGVPLFDRLIEEQSARVLALEGEESILTTRLADAEARRNAALRQANEKKESFSVLGDALEKAGERWSALEPAKEGIGSGESPDALIELANRMEEVQSAAALLREREKKEQECRHRLDEVRRVSEQERRSRDEAQEKVIAIRRRMQEVGAKAGAAMNAVAVSFRTCGEALEALSDPL